MARQRRHWHHRARHALSHSLRLRLMALFLLLALAMAATFIFGMQKALSVGWRDAARPLVSDYVDRLVAEIGSPPSIERAQALTRRLPISVQIAGPVVNWRSGAQTDAWQHFHPHDDAQDPSQPRLLVRTTADGHRIELGVSVAAWENQPRRVGWFTLAGILALTALAYAHVRHLLRPLDDIRAGAQRFGSGAFGEPIPVRHRDELGQLASDVNAMARSIHQMLDAKRALLLAISHELRSPLTRARLNTELLPEAPDDVAARREALLRDLGEMRDLVTDLLESERLGQGHAALQLEPVDLPALVREVVDALAQTHGGTVPTVALEMEAGLPALQLDRARMRLLLRNLLDNALRHSADAEQAPLLRLLRAAPGAGVVITVRDHGPGVAPSALPRLAEPFYRPDTARGRSAGGVGLGLYLCKLVAQAHGGSLDIANTQPGLAVTVTLPAQA